MEKHHLHRRDPNWHPNSCNTCGQLGHQAANCPNGTVNLRNTYGDDAFILRGPVYYSDLLEREKYKKKQMEDLEGRAKEYAKTHAVQEGLNWVEIEATAARLHATEPEEIIKPIVQSIPAAAPVAAAEAPGGAAADALPPGWAIAYDANNNKPYFWHRTTKKVQWDRPTDGTPIQ